MTADARTLPGDDGRLYERLGVPADVELAVLRAAYRRRARELHPDLHHDASSDTQLQMALVNEAWSVLSDPQRRQDYDLRRLRQRRAAEAPERAAAAEPAPVFRAHQSRQPQIIVTRKEAWLTGMAVRIRFLAGYAGRSAVQAMLLRHPGTGRAAWEAMVPEICRQLSVDTGDRVRAARAAGAAPLDLANAAALIGLQVYGESLLVAPPPRCRWRIACATRRWWTASSRPWRMNCLATSCTVSATPLGCIDA